MRYCVEKNLHNVDTYKTGQFNDFMNCKSEDIVAKSTL